MLMRWPIHHTCHNQFLPQYGPPKKIEFGPLTKRGEWKVDPTNGLRSCSVCESVHPEDLHNLLVEKRITIHLAEHDGWPSRYMIKGIGGVLSFTTLHLGDYGYGSAEIKALCTEISKAQSKYIWEPDVDAIYWKPKEAATGVAKKIRNLSKLLKPVTEELKIPTPKEVEVFDPKEVENWKTKMEREVQEFKKSRRGW